MMTLDLQLDWQCSRLFFGWQTPFHIMLMSFLIRFRLLST